MVNIIKEELPIEDSFKTLLSDILKYDNVVNDMYEDIFLDDDYER